MGNQTVRARPLKCCCCGGYAGRWQQWPSRDTGYGVCHGCAQQDRRRGMPEDEMRDNYGVEGVHWGALSQPKPALFTPVQKLGRLSDGFERDHGTVVHALAAYRYAYGAKTPALCGTRPGRRSVGWGESPAGADVTCRVCKRRIARRLERQEVNNG